MGVWRLVVVIGLEVADEEELAVDEWDLLGCACGPLEHFAEREVAAVGGTDPLRRSELPHLLDALAVDVEPGDAGNRCA